MVPTMARSLLRPHLEDVDNKIQPGAVILTWASMNIDGYLHHIHQVGWDVHMCLHTGMICSADMVNGTIPDSFCYCCTLVCYVQTKAASL